MRELGSLDLLRERSAKTLGERAMGSFFFQCRGNLGWFLSFKVPKTKNYG